MKTCLKNPYLLPVLAASLGSGLADQLAAQSFTILHSFTATAGPFPGPYTNGDGANPGAALILSGSTLYGTASGGGSGGAGTVFKVNTDGTLFTTLHSFGALSSSSSGTNSDGAWPGGLVLSGNTLYGTAGGGSSGNGTVFAVKTDGSAFSILHEFTGPYCDTCASITNTDGIFPSGGLVLCGNTLYGATVTGGSSGNGTVFKVNTDGSGFKTLYVFSAAPPGSVTVNADGAWPSARLLLSGSTLYGTAEFGGSSGSGTVFALSTNGTGFTTLHNFGGADGAVPRGELILSGNTLYGTASAGGDLYRGTVFKLKTDGTGFTRLYSFTDSDSGIPAAGLTLFDDSLCGTTYGGGIDPGPGTVFMVNIDGTGFKTLHNFAYTFVTSMAPLTLSGNILYGTASDFRNISGSGTVFSILLPPQLTLTAAGASVIVRWPTNFTGYALQSTTNLVVPFWTTNLPAPTVVNEQNTVTNPLSSAQRFYRLTQ